MNIGGITVRPGGSANDLRFESFVGRLRRFSRSDVASIATHISWTIWKTETPDPEPADWYLCRAFMPTIAVLGIAVCHDNRDRKVPTEHEMRALANDLLGVRAPISDERLRPQELESLDHALRASAHFAKVATDADSLRAVHAFISVARDLRAQWSFRASTPAAFIRAWAVAANLEAQVPGFLKRLSGQWNIGLRDLLRCCFALLAIADDNPNTLGAFSLNALGTEEVEPYGISLEALRLVANRLGQPPGHFNEWYRGTVLAHPDSLRKYVPHPLVADPLVTIDHTLKKRYTAPRHSYLCPSPSHLIWRAQSIVVDAARAQGLATEVGHAISKYVGDLLIGICGAEAVVNLDEVFGPESPTHADYAVLLGMTAIIIESKTSLGSAAGKSIITPGDYVESWHRIWEAYLQCARTPFATQFRGDRRLAGVTNFVYLVTFEEQMCIEAAALNSVAFADGLFRAEGFSRAEAVTLQELEDALVLYGPERLAAEVAAKWQSGHHGNLLSAHLRKRPQPGKPFSDRGYAAAHARELFGSERVLDAIRAGDTRI
jgi:hypothetical protein